MWVSISPFKPPRFIYILALLLSIFCYIQNIVIKRQQQIIEMQRKRIAQIEKLEAKIKKIEMILKRIKCFHDQIAMMLNPRYKGIGGPSE